MTTTNNSMSNAQNTMGGQPNLRPEKKTYNVSSLGSNLKFFLRTEQWPDKNTGEMGKVQLKYVAQSEMLKNTKGYPIDISLSLDLEQLEAFQQHIEEVIDFVKSTGFEQSKRIDSYSKDMEELKKQFS